MCIIQIRHRSGYRCPLGVCRWSTLGAVSEDAFPTESVLQSCTQQQKVDTPSVSNTEHFHKPAHLGGQVGSATQPLSAYGPGLHNVIRSKRGHGLTENLLAGDLAMSVKV